MSLESFKASRTGAKLRPILSSDAQIARMVEKSRSGRPAVEAIGAQIASKVGRLDDEQKKLVGRWVRELLEPRGWVPFKKGRVAPGNLFARGTVYRPLASGASPGERPSAVERIAAARAILATMPHPIMTSDELIVERRREAAREG